MKKFTKEIGRQQFNVVLDRRVILALKSIASDLQIPLYPLCEHLLQLGLSEVLTIVEDEAQKEILQRHLLEDHLLVKELQPMNEPISKRALRIKNALRWLSLIEAKCGSVEEVKRIIDKVIYEA